MKIESAQVDMSSRHLFRESHVRQESLRVWHGETRPDFENQDDSKSTTPTFTTDRVTLSDEVIRQKFVRTTQSQPAQEKIEIELEGDSRLMAMRMVLEALTGREIRIASLDQNSGQDNLEVSQQGEQAEEAMRAGWGLEYDLHESHSEHEEMAYSAQGQVRTADGQQFSFEVQLATTRDFMETSDFHIRAGDAQLIDPLVVNFNGQSAQLSDIKIAFDLDNDGKNEDIAFLKPGSGFLFLDRNNDGYVSDGSELFGPATGSGFTELAAYDSDLNGWLDENDPLFAKLQIWAKDRAGSNYFHSLKEKNIGAIFLGSESTPFTLTNEENSRLGVITDTGLFLRENAEPGTIQEINLVF